MPDAQSVTLESQPARSIRVLEIAARPGWRGLDLQELWSYRELLQVLVWRDLKVRYRQTLLGVFWVLGQPLLSMLVFTFLFNRIARFESGHGIPYSVYVLLGLLPWNFFAAGVQGSGNSLVGSSHLISKVYFPRLLVPIASVVGGLADLAVAGLLAAGLLLWHQLVPGATLVLMPLVLLALLALCLGAGLWLSALNVEYRDVRVLIPFILQVWMYATPVVYPLNVLPPGIRRLVLLNPLTGVVEAFRACVVGGAIPWTALGWSGAVGASLLVSGAYYFRRMERTFADLL